MNEQQRTRAGRDFAAEPHEGPAAIDGSTLQEQRLAAIAEHGKAHLQNMDASMLQRLPRGHYMMIDVPTGQFITAPSLSMAIDLFTQKFPAGTAFVHRIGENLLPRRPIA